MPVEVQQDRPLQAIANLFGHANVDLDTFQAAAIRGGVDFVYNHLVPALNAVADHFKSLELNRAGNSKLVAQEYGFLQALAAISPNLEQYMQQAGILDLEPRQILTDAKKLKAMQDFLAYVLETDNLKELHLSLARKMQEFYTRQHKAALQKARELKHCHAQHQEPAHAEYTDLGMNAINNARSNEMFDPVKVIGHLLSALFELHYKAPLRNLLYPHIKHDYTPVSMSNDPRMKLNMERYGGLLEPTAAMPAGGPMPSGFKPGGPGAAG
jgi:hypothetical protein